MRALKFTPTLVAVLLAGCGGGGSDSPGETLVSGSPPAAASPPAPTPAAPAAAPAETPSSPPPAAGPPTRVNPPPAPPPVTVVVVTPPPPVEAKLPANAPPVHEAVRGPKAPPADKPKAPQPAQVVQTIAGKALINALRTPRHGTKLSSDTAGDNFFSEVQTEFFGATFGHRSSFTPLETPYGGADLTPLPRKNTDLTLDAAVAPDAFTFGGTGTIAFAQVNYPLQGPQYSVPAQVPLNTAKLVEWKVPGTAHWVRFNVGNVTGHPERFRACIDILLPGLDRVSCTHHDRVTGAPVGADTIERIDGRETVHQTNEESESPRRVLDCTFREEGRFIEARESYSYSMFQFKHPHLYQNRSLTLELESRSPEVTYTQTDLGGGLTREEVTNPRSNTRFNRRGNAVEEWQQRFGFIDYGYRKTCVYGVPQ